MTPRIGRTVGQLAAIIDAIPTALVMVDGNLRIELLNAQAELLYGYSRGELQGATIEVLVPPRFREEYLSFGESFLQAAPTRTGSEIREFICLRKNGDEFPAKIGISSVMIDDSFFVLASINDIAERKQSEASLRQAIEALERSNMELQRFAYAASHDLQTPMRSIASFIQLLQENYSNQLDQRGRDWMRRTFESVKQLQALVRDLLEYSSVDAQARPFEAVSMRDVFDHVVDLLSASIAETHAQIESGALPVVQGNRTQLVQLLLNLLDNALKYRSAAVPEIRVTATLENDEWLFAVRDNGIGISERYQRRIFEPFQRLHEQREIPGTGIGLATCSRVVQRHGGKIWVESEPGRGSVFYFTLPQEAES